MKTFFTYKYPNLKKCSQHDENLNQKSASNNTNYPQNHENTTNYNDNNKNNDRDYINTLSLRQPHTTSWTNSNNLNMNNSSTLKNTTSQSMNSTTIPNDPTLNSNMSLNTQSNKDDTPEPSLTLANRLNNTNNSDIHEYSPNPIDENNISSTNINSTKHLREELKETKSKLKILTTKFHNIKKERDNYQRENKNLQDEIMSLQSAFRQMIPGFSNTGSSFPMFNELINNISEFYKYDCEEIFFDLLCPELNMKGIILFYYICFQKITQTVADYFAPSENIIKETACLSTLEGPVMNVLRKSYQATWKNIAKQCFTESIFDDIINEIQKNLSLGNCSLETKQQINNFLTKMGDLLLSFYISDPPVFSNYKVIGSKVQYNSIKHEPLDGFIKNKEECIIILPSIHKGNVDGEIVTKALVLQVDYQTSN